MHPESDPSLVSPKAMTSDGRIFKLDMSFNRTDPSMDPTRRFASGIDPFGSPPVFQSPRPVPSNLVADASPEEWQEFYRQWSFPTRTDSPRGLTWGPFHDKCAQPSEPVASLPPSPTLGTKRTHNVVTAVDLEPSVGAKRRKILPILRPPPRNPLIIRLKINSSQATSHQSLGDSAYSLTANHLAVSNLGHLVDVLVSPAERKLPPKSRITLSYSSQLKYCS